MVGVCAIPFYICVRLGLSREEKYSSHIKEKTVGLKRGSNDGSCEPMQKKVVAGQS